MRNATLNYIIDTGVGERILRLESGSLFYMDRNTSPYRNEEDFICHYYNRNKIYKFIKENGNLRGRLTITYAKSVEEKENVPILFNTKTDFVFDDDPYEGKITEIEKARRLLFNSKNQLFTRLLTSTTIMDDFKKKLMIVTDKERLTLEKNGYKTFLYQGNYYVRFNSLFEYRLNNKRLGNLRNLYEDMLNGIKREITLLDDNDFYYYNRQFKYIIDKYNKHTNELSVSNLKIGNIKPNNKYVISRNNLYHL